ncbi:hypothetical protein I3760_12G054400 [Carya illinoinensis]|nr:hypothetical protein I3760_12G054400 [Carya illinoinensis]
MARLPANYGISPIFNIEDLTQFHGSEETLPLASDLNTQQDAVIRVPKNTAPRDEIASILNHQFVTTRRGGYYKFLVQWKNLPSLTLFGYKLRSSTDFTQICLLPMFFKTCRSQVLLSGRQLMQIRSMVPKRNLLLKSWGG